MGSEKYQNSKILEELRKSLAPRQNAEEEERPYTFRQYTIDGERFSTLADLKGRDIKVVTPEQTTVANFAKMLSESGDPKSRDFARTVKNIAALHEAGGDDLKESPIYSIAKEYTERTLSTRPASVERDLLLITAVEKVKAAYRALIKE